MNKIKTILIISIAVLGGVLLFNLNASANSVLVVQFQPNPLFNQMSFLPGDTATASVIVTNNSAQTQKIGTQAINFSDLNHLGDVLHLVITEGAFTRYSGTLSQFYNAGEIHLSDLAGNGANTTYYYAITFDLNAGDTYQGKGLGFDIVVGFLGESIGQEIPPGVGGGGGGASSGGLIIFNEAIGGLGSATVTITWDTNLSATSRVIYSPLSSAPVFNPSNPPNYGYDFSTTEDTNKVTDHTVIIPGLNPATTYVFRCVSHNSPDTLSPEYSFTTLGPGETPIEGIQQLGEQMGEVLGAAVIRTALPETGGILNKIAKSNESKINLILASGLIFIWIVLFLIRKRIKHLT